MKNKEQIMNEYAVRLGYEDFIHLLNFNSGFEHLNLKHINAVTDLIQKELLNRVTDEVLINGSEFSRCGCEINFDSILNTPIL